MVEVYIDSVNYTDKRINVDFTRENSLGVGNFELTLLDYDNAIFNVIEQDDKVELISNNKSQFYGFITKISRPSAATLKVSGLSYKGLFEKTRPIYQWYETNSKDIVQKLLSKTLSTQEFEYDGTPRGTRTLTAGTQLIATKITADSNHQFLDKVQLISEGCNYIDYEYASKPYIIASIYPDNGSGSPDVSSSPEAFSITEPVVINFLYPILTGDQASLITIDFKENIDISTNDKWLVIQTTGDTNGSVLFETDTSVSTAKYSSDSGTSWASANPLVSYFYTTPKNIIDYTTHFSSGSTINYSIEHNSVSQAIKQLTDNESYSFFDRFDHDGVDTYLKLDNDVIDVCRNTFWTPLSITYGTDRNANANSAVVFNGSSGYILTTKNTRYWEWKGEFSISLWAYFSTVSSGDRVLWLTGSGTDGCSLTINSSSKLVFTIYGTGGGSITSSYAMPTSVWRHITITRDETNTVKMYITNSGQPDTMTSSTVVYPDGYYLYIGSSGMNVMDGKLDQIMFMKEALSHYDVMDIVDGSYSYPDSPSSLDLHWETPTTTTNVGDCDLVEGQNILKYNIKETEIINKCKVYGIDKLGKELLATYQDDTSITSHGIKQIVIRRNNLNTYEECYNAAKELVTTFKDKNLTGWIDVTWSTASWYNADLLFPNTVQVTIPTQSIDDTYVAQRVNWKYPTSVVRVHFAEDITDFKQVIGNISQANTDMKQAKNLDDADNSLTVDFTNPEYKPYTLYDGVSQEADVGVTLDSTDNDNIKVGDLRIDKFQTNKKVNYIKADISGENVANSWVEQSGVYYPLPIGNGFVSSTNCWTNAAGGFGVTCLVKVNPLRYYGATEDTVFEFDMAGNTQKLTLDISKVNDNRIVGLDSNINVVDNAMGAYYPTLFFVCTKEYSGTKQTYLHVFNEFWALVNKINLTTLTTGAYTTGLTINSVVTGIGVTAYPDISKILIYLTFHNAPFQFITTIGVDEDGLNESLFYAYYSFNQNYYIEDLSFINGGSSSIDTEPDFRFIAVLQHKTTGDYTIGIFRHRHHPWPTTSTYYYVSRYDMPCSTEYTPIPKSVCSIKNDVLSGSSDYSGKYTTLVSTLYEGTTDDNIYANEYIYTIHKSSTNTGSPYVFKRNVVNSFYLPTKGIARGLLNPVLKSFKADVFENHNTYKFPIKYKESDFV